MSEDTMGIVCKPLEWDERDYCPSAECVFGHYIIHPGYCHVELLVGYGKSTMTSLGRVQLEAGASLHQLKAAAQTDYGRRIFPALAEQRTSVNGAHSMTLTAPAVPEDQEEMHSLAESVGMRFVPHKTPPVPVKPEQLKTAKTIDGLLRSMGEAADNTTKHYGDYFRDAVTVIEALRYRLVLAKQPPKQDQGDIPLLDDLQRHVGDIGDTEIGQDIQCAIDVIRSLTSPPSLAAPDGWKVSAHKSDGRTWLTITMPSGKSASLSCKMSHDSGETLASQIVTEFARLTASPTPPAMPGWECAARKQGTAGGNDTADCDWPHCGCDQVSPPLPAAPGWKLVPVGPTSEMLAAMWEAMFEDKFNGTQAPMAGAGYDAALAASPTTPASTLGEAKVAFGLEAQGHIQTIEAMLKHGEDWEAIGQLIGWDGQTAKQYYERLEAPAITAADLTEGGAA